MKPTNQRRSSERGTQVVEFAIVLPLLVFLAMLVTEGADLVRTHQVLNNAAREGAKFSSMPENDCTTAGATCITAIKTVAVQYAANNRVTITTGNVTVNQSVQIVPAAGAAAFHASQVTVTYQFPMQFFRSMPGFNIPATLQLQGMAQFRNFWGN